mmetsp:Transcript_10656/g.18731  ORF Transcript_10656/g.18731 Transcript_10656/m.18731 type:complete len:111 (+) Transcript_10656:125-457(+)
MGGIFTKCCDGSNDDDATSPPSGPIKVKNGDEMESEDLQQLLDREASLCVRVSATEEEQRCTSRDMSALMREDSIMQALMREDTIMQQLVKAEEEAKKDEKKENNVALDV